MRPYRTCSLNATTRLARSPMLVIGRDPMRTRMPLAPAGERAGGLISAGMISTVQTPFPILAQTMPNTCPAFWAPSPESLTISTMCSSSVTGARVAATGVSDAERDESFMSGRLFPCIAHHQRSDLRSFRVRGVCEQRPRRRYRSAVSCIRECRGCLPGSSAGP